MKHLTFPIEVASEGRLGKPATGASFPSFRSHSGSASNGGRLVMVSQWKKSIFKGAIKGVLPFHSYLRRIKREITPYTDSQFNTRFAFEQGIEQIKNLKQLNAKINGTVLEFGSGWLPVIPILFHIYGANEIVLADIERLMDARTIDLAKGFVKNNIS